MSEKDIVDGQGFCNKCKQRYSVLEGQPHICPMSDGVKLPEGFGEGQFQGIKGFPEVAILQSQNKALQAENTRLKELLREASEELMTHPAGLCNRIHQALSGKG